MVSIISLVVAIIILSIKTSFILGSSWLTKKQGLAISIVFGIALFLLTMLAAHFTDILSYYLYQYTFESSIIIAVFLIYLGLSNSKSTCESTKKYKSVVAFLPCPFCLVALAIAIILTSINFNVQLWKISLLASIIFALTNATLISILKVVISNKSLDKAYIFDTLLIFIGSATIVFSLFIPNFIKAAQMNFSPIIIESINIVTIVILTSIIISTIGYFLYFRTFLTK